MTDEIQRILWALDGRYGYLIAFSAWVTVLRFSMKWVSGMFQAYLTQAAVDSDKVWVSSVLNNRFYKFAAFLLDYLASTKLPNADIVAARKGDTLIITKPTV
jgi:hypothetical protein